MLQIIIIKNPGEEDEQHCEVNLFSNTQITIVWENPLFLYDSISAMFSLSIELPASVENLVHFNYPNRIAALGVVEKFPAMIRHSGLMIARGELVLHMFSENIHGQFIGSVEISKRPLTELDMSEVEFSDIDVYGVTSFGHSPDEPDYSDLKWAEYKSEALAASDYSPGMTYCHAPVKKKYVPWDGHEALFGVKNSLLQYINFYNAREKKYHLVNENTIHTPVVPFFSVAYVIDKIFGDSLTDNPFSQGDLAHLFFISPGHPNYKNELYHTSISHLIPPVFMGWYESITIREFLLPVSENTLFGLLSIIGT